MADEFARLVAQMSVAGVCESFGFSSVQRSALEALTDILGRYIESTGRAAHSYAESAGRTDANLSDVMLALEDMGTSLSDVAKFVEFVEETGPAQPVPKFPVAKKTRVATPSFLQRGERPPRSDFPDWLPSLPDKHTYVSTPVWEEPGQTEAEALAQEGKQRRKAEQSLVRLHQRMERLTAGGYQAGSTAGSLWGSLGQAEGSEGSQGQGCSSGAPAQQQGTAPFLAGAASAATAAARLRAGAPSTPVGSLGMPGRGGDGTVAAEGGVGEARMTSAALMTSAPSIMDAFSPALGDGPAKSRGVKGTPGLDPVLEGSSAKEGGDSKWSGWAVPTKPAPGSGPGSAPATSSGGGSAKPGQLAPRQLLPGVDSPGGGRVAFGLQSSLKRKAMAVRCRVAVQTEDVLGRREEAGEEERKEKVGKEDEQEEKRRKVEQMLREAEAGEA